MTLSAYGQNLQVTGVVSDEYNEPLIGVAVAIKGTTTGVVTDMDGKYTIDTPSDATLVFSYLGTATQEIPVKGQRIIHVKMKENVEALEEVVVIGYGTVRKADLTTSVASVTSDEWRARPIIDAGQGLQGKAAGVQVVQPSGKPGASLSIRVRGSTSLNAGNSPLYVVDGIPTTDISNVSPSDIENMQILKDASSAAIYGARAANGVVLITTKRGKEGRAQVNVSMYAGVSNISKTIDVLNTTEYYELMDEIGISLDKTNTFYKDWAKEMYGTGLQQNYQASLSGGTDKTSYYISGGFQDEKGIIEPARFNRYSFRTNLSSEIKPWLKATTNLSFSKTDNRNVVDNSNVDRGGVVMSILNTPPFMDVWDPQNPGWYYVNPLQGSWENPRAQADTYDKTKEYRLMGNVGLEFTIYEGLHFKPNFSLDYSSRNWDKFIHPLRTNYGRQANGRGENRNENFVTWLSENLITYDTKINDSHNLGILGGATFQRYRYDQSYISVEDFVKGSDYEVMTLNMANKINDAYTTRAGNSLVSFIGRVQYDYESRYLFTANFRADGSSKLHPDHRWGYFPSVSGGWRFSSERFFEPLTKVVNDAKIRFGWGKNGNQTGIGDYDYYNKYTITKRAPGESLEGPGLSPGRYGNRDLKWETTTQINVGLDFTLFDSRLSGEVDWYHKKTTDLLLYITLPSSIGRPNPMRNDGEMVNKGFEFNLNVQILTGEFRWDAGLNMSFNKNELTKLGLTPQYATATIEGKGEVIRIAPGRPLGSFFGYVSQGVDPETGDVIYEDLNGDGVITSSDRTYIGDAQPDFTFGMTHNFSFRNFTLSAFFHGSYGNDIFNASRIDTEGMFNSKNQTTAVLNRWKRPGMITDVPRAGNDQNSRISSRFVEDGSFLRLKTLTLAYDFDRKVVTKIGMQGLTLYATATNLFTLTKYRGYDPELSWISTGTESGAAAQMGIDWGTFPQTRSFIFGLNVTF